MDSKQQIAYAAAFITKLKESAVFDDPRFFTYLTEATKNNQDADSNTKGTQDASNLVDAFKKHLESDPANDPKLIEKHKRLYVDGCFDLMHSGHFNAIRQVSFPSHQYSLIKHSDSGKIPRRGPRYRCMF